MLRCLGDDSVYCRVQHILNEDAVAACRIVDQHVCDRADELAVLDDRRARRVGGQ